MSWGGYEDEQLEPVALALATGQGEPAEARRYFYLASQVLPALDDLAALTVDPKHRGPAYRRAYADGVLAGRAGITDTRLPGSNDDEENNRG